MKIFIDTANTEEIKAAARMGMISGVTTNPSLIAKEGRVFEEVICFGGAITGLESGTKNQSLRVLVAFSN